MTDETAAGSTNPEQATTGPTIRPLLNLLPGIPAAEVCGPDGCAPADRA